MSFHVMTLPCADEDRWALELTELLEAQDAEGFGLIAMATRTVAIQVTQGMGGATKYETQLVLVFQGG